ncbi:MAG: GNAT family N-acetyltransferase [Candidatus Thorarchaeota archaeon]|nr:GNAT family N-acetyltransferase [Candidatus Thorarchaeota archaeon]
MADQSQIIELEQIAFNAWVAEENERFGGWLLRANGGITRRANSVLTIGPPPPPLDDAIEKVISFYKDRNLIPRFQMTEASKPIELDRDLSERGFSVGLQVEVHTAAINHLVQTETALDVLVSNNISDGWMSVYSESSGYDISTMETRKELLKRTTYTKGYALARIGRELAGVGFGVVEGKWLGLFNIAVHPSMRGRGVAIAINTALAKWAHNLGARSAYLQVETENLPALKLYEKLGFQYAYAYWYRKLDEEK